MPMPVDAGGAEAGGPRHGAPAHLAGWVWHVGSDAITWADSGFEMDGYRPSLVAPDMRGLLSRVHEHDRGRLHALLLRADEERVDSTCHFRYWLPDGQQRHLLLKTLFRLRDAGGPGRVAGTLHDVTDHVDIEKALHESMARFAQFGEAASDVLWIRNARSLRLEYLSQAFDGLYGCDRGTMLANPTLDSWTRLILPEDRHRVHEALERVRAGERIVVEYRIRRGDGAIRWMRNTKFPLLDCEGRVVRIGGIGHDATEEKEASGRAQVLMAELQHRTRNLMAVMRAVAERTLDECGTLGEFRDAYCNRITAIARAHTLLSSLDEGGTVTFDRLLFEELEAHGADRARVVLDGPGDVALESATLQTLALALHELMTNATKYGALSAASGRLEVRWRRGRREDGTPVLRMEWNEVSHGTAPPDDGRKGGYGRELIERALPYQLKARTSYRLTGHGVECVVEVPLPVR
ncbi:sensor histidine kinase [Stenotrophomonas nitritireducens]|uniref:sensor histidine kinase n=1 Tax=Stenotrophomonas nitritireducens TaxID=83617 RepID=UPI003D9767A7